MIAWLKCLGEVVSKQQSCVLITVARTRGSTPRDIGAKMIVTRNQTIGSIGGGQLEYQCTKVACDWLSGDSGKGRSRLERFPLGTNCGQCCGGVAEILFEEIDWTQSEWINALLTCHNEGRDAVMLTIAQSRLQGGKLIVTADKCFGDCDELATNTGILVNARRALNDNAGVLQSSVACNSNVEIDGTRLPILIEPIRANDFSIVVFGAGHVGSACVDIFSKLDANIRLVDSRHEIIESGFPFPEPCNVQAIHAKDPSSLIPYLPANGYYLIMTHDHALDLELCIHLLRRTDIAYCGLIGSLSKRRRFDKRFRALGLSTGEVSRLTCPIGVEDIRGKKPYEIAIAVSAQLLNIREAGINTVPTAGSETLSNLLASRHGS